MSPLNDSTEIKYLECEKLCKKGKLDDTFINKAKIWIPSSPNLSSIYLDDKIIDCQELLRTFQFIQYPLSQSEADYPLAYGFHVYTNIYQVLLVLSAFYHPQNLYCIGIDSNSKGSFKSQVQLLQRCLSNITIIVSLNFIKDIFKEFPKVRWCSFGTLRALYGCFEHLTKTRHPWRYYQYISNHDLPLKTNYEMVQIFRNLNGAVITEMTKKHSVENNTLDLPLYKTSMSALISREAANYVVNNSKVKTVLSQIKSTRLSACPDEVLWGTLFGNNRLMPAPGSFDLPKLRDEFLKALKKSSNKAVSVELNDSKADPFNLAYYYIPRYQVWAGSARKCHGKHVHTSCVYGVADIPTLMTRPELVAHKLYYDYQPAAFYCLRELIKKRAHDPDQKLFKAHVYANLAHVRILAGNDPKDVSYIH